MEDSQRSMRRQSEMQGNWTYTATSGTATATTTARLNDLSFLDARVKEGSALGGDCDMDVSGWSKGVIGSMNALHLIHWRWTRRD